MTRIKLCGLTRPCDIEIANELLPDYVGFVFYPPSRRCVTPTQAAVLRAGLRREIRAVGVFVDETPETIADLLARGVIDAAQLHGREDNDYIARLRALTDRPVFQAFRVAVASDLALAAESAADLILLDAGSGGGNTFDWSLAAGCRRPYLLAGGLAPENVGAALTKLSPFGVDVSSGIETNGRKDADRMRAFVRAVRSHDREERAL